ncbi:hypothetical protein Tco_0313343 [Tanacetum coccineum]
MRRVNASTFWRRHGRDISSSSSSRIFVLGFSCVPFLRPSFCYEESSEDELTLLRACATVLGVELEGFHSRERLYEFANKPVVENKKSDEEVSKAVRKSDDALIIKDWVSDSEEENMSQTKTEKKTVKPSITKIEFVKPKQQEKTARKTIKQVEKHRQNTHSPRGNQINWNNMMSQRLGSNFEMFNKACYVCGSFDHLQVDCNFHQKQFQNQRIIKPVWNNSQRVNH